MSPFFIILGSVFLADLIVWGLGTRWVRRATRPWRVAFHAYMAFQFLSLAAIVAGRVWEWDLDAIFPVYGYSIVFLWHLLLLPVALIIALVALPGSWVKAFLQRRQAAPSEPLPGAPMSRRDFLAASTALTPPFLSLALGAIASEQLSQFRVRKIDIPLANLPPALDGVTIAHLSDLHVGRFSNGKVLDAIRESTNALKADLVTFTGDLINDSIVWLPEAVRMFQEIDRPVYVCEGNHDLIDDPAAFYHQLKSARGINLLLDETETVSVRGQGVQLMGLRWAGRARKGRTDTPQPTVESSLAALLRQRDPSAFSILLAHHPHAWDAAGPIPLTLAGHTHGGQLMASENTGFGPLMFRYWSGLYTREGAALAVSNGVGNWFPLRVGAPAEILHLTLRRA